jgi:hypothetical protein
VCSDQSILCWPREMPEIKQTDGETMLSHSSWFSSLNGCHSTLSLQNISLPSIPHSIWWGASDLRLLVRRWCPWGQLELAVDTSLAPNILVLSSPFHRHCSFLLFLGIKNEGNYYKNMEFKCIFHQPWALWPDDSNKPIHVCKIKYHWDSHNFYWNLLKPTSKNGNPEVVRQLIKWTS